MVVGLEKVKPAQHREGDVQRKLQRYLRLASSGSHIATADLTAAGLPVRVCKQEFKTCTVVANLQL